MSVVLPQFYFFMAKTRQAKEATIADLSERMGRAKSMVFANFQGLKMKELDELRDACRSKNIGYIVSKKTLIKKVLHDRGFEIDATAFAGGVSVLFGYDDEVAPAQTIAQFGKAHEAVRLFGGVLEGAFIDGSKVAELAKLPTKIQLLGQLVGTLNAPISGFVNVLAGNMRGLVTVLSAIQKAKS